MFYHLCPVYNIALTPLVIRIYPVHLMCKLRLILLWPDGIKGVIDMRISERRICAYDKSV